MRVLINALSLSNPYGIGRYTRTLLEGLSLLDEKDLSISVYAREPCLAGFSESSAFELVEPGRPAASRLYLEQVDLPIISRRIKPDVYFSPDFTLPEIRVARRLVVTVHDLLIYTHPESISTRARLLYRAFLPRALKRADVILADSAATLSAIRERFPEAAEKVRVVKPALDLRYFKDESEGSKPEGETAPDWFDLPFLLYVGSNSSRKNLPVLVDSFKRWRKECGWRGRLVLIGGNGALSDTEGSVIDAGFQGDDVIVECYRRAAGLVLISSAEGFGYPVAEALASGCPVMTTRGSAMSEISPSGGGVIEVDPNEKNEVIRGLDRLVSENESLRAAVKTDEMRALYHPLRIAKELVKCFKD